MRQHVTLFTAKSSTKPRVEASKFQSKQIIMKLTKIILVRASRRPCTPTLCHCHVMSYYSSPVHSHSVSLSAANRILYGGFATLFFGPANSWPQFFLRPAAIFFRLAHLRNISLLFLNHAFSIFVI